MQTRARKEQPKEQGDGRDGRPRRRSQVERSAATRSALLGAARTLFSEQGYTATGREEIAERAGVTRGALYHHFASKAEVFSAVLQALDDELVERIVAASDANRDSPLETLRRGARTYVDACAEPDVARILSDAPSVLGLDVYRELNARSCQALIVPALEAIRVEQGELPGDIDVLAAILLASLNEAAFIVATSTDRTRTKNLVSRTVDQVLSRLLLQG